MIAVLPAISFSLTWILFISITNHVSKLYPHHHTHIITFPIQMLLAWAWAELVKGGQGWLIYRLYACILCACSPRCAISLIIFRFKNVNLSSGKVSIEAQHTVLPYWFLPPIFYQ